MLIRCGDSNVPENPTAIYLFLTPNDRDYDKPRDETWITIRHQSHFLGVWSSKADELYL